MLVDDAAIMAVFASARPFSDRYSQWANEPEWRCDGLLGAQGLRHWQTWQLSSVTRQLAPKTQVLARLPPGQ
jgi:hypothetical protein